jgi:hypothetical protein
VVVVHISTIFPSSGLVSEFLFNNDPGSSVVNSKDPTNPGSYGPTSGSPSVAKTSNRFGTANAALIFDDSDPGVTGQFPYASLRASRYDDEMTWAMWVKPNGGNDALFNQLGWIQASLTSSLQLRFTLPDTSDSPWIYDSPRAQVTASQSLTTGEWNFIAITMDYSSPNTTIRLYRAARNGTIAEVGSTTVGGRFPNPGINNNAKRVYLGVNRSTDDSNDEFSIDDSVPFFDGSFDDVRIYDRPLTVPELQALVDEPNNF